MKPRNTSPAEILALARALIAAARDSRLDEIARICAPHAVAWHNVTDKTVSLTESLRIFGALAAEITSLNYEDIRITPLEGGYVQQHTLVGQIGDQSLRLSACIVCAVENGQITRIEEFFDSGALKAVGLALS